MSGASKLRRKPKHPESDLQQSCVKWFRCQHARISRLLFAIPNGGRRGRIEASIMSGEGVTAGVADLFLSVPNRGFYGFYIEMKMPGKYQTKEQVEFEIAVTAQGYKYLLCRNVEQFIKEVNDYLS